MDNSTTTLSLISIERLKPENWQDLDQLSEKITFDPLSSVVVVARKEGRVIGRIALQCPVHAEGVFIEPKYRGKELFHRLMQGIEQEAKVEGIKCVFAYAIDGAIAALLSREGYTNVPWTIWKKELK